MYNIGLIFVAIGLKLKTSSVNRQLTLISNVLRNKSIGNPDKNLPHEYITFHMLLTFVIPRCFP